MTKPASTGLILAGAFSAALLTLWLAHTITREQIEESQSAWAMQSLNAVLTNGPFDNEPLASRRQHIVEALGSSNPLNYYIAFKTDKPAAVVLEVIAPQGYNGEIKLLLGLNYAGEILGVRTLSHRETPGLADDLDIRKSNWVTAFNGQSLATSTYLDWQVRQQGGQYDAFTGATITPQAVIQAVYKALQWYESDKEQLFTP